MSFGKYVRAHIWQLLLVFLSAWSAAQVGFNAFFINEDLQASWLPAVAVLILVLELYVAVYKRRWMIFGAVGFVVLAAAYVGVALAMSTGKSLYADVAANYLYFALVIIVASLLCFLLTRTLVGGVVWFIGAVFMCSVIQGFYKSDELLFSIAVLACGLALVLERNFRAGMKEADSVRKMTPGINVISALVPVIIGVAVAATVWFAVIAPLEPGVLKINLITDYRQLPVVQMKGVEDVQPEYNVENTTKQLVDGERYGTDDLATSDDATTTINAKSLTAEQRAEAGKNKNGGGSSGTHSALDEKSQKKKFKAMSYDTVVPYILYVLIAMVIVAALIALALWYKRWRRKRRMLRFLEGTPRQQISAIYLFLLSRLGRLGYKKPKGSTLEEFAENTRLRMEDLCMVTQVPFTELTRIYVECAYSGREPSDDELLLFVVFYQGLWKAARKELGAVRYFFKSFVL